MAFGFGLSELVSDRISISVAANLTKGVLWDSGSHTFAASQEWNRPVDENTLVLAQLLDRFTQANFESPDDYPRPWVLAPRRSTEAEISQAKAMLMARGPRPKEG